MEDLERYCKFPKGRLRHFWRAHHTAEARVGEPGNEFDNGDQHQSTVGARQSPVTALDQLPQELRRDARRDQLPELVQHLAQAQAASRLPDEEESRNESELKNVGPSFCLNLCTETTLASATYPCSPVYREGRILHSSQK